MIRNKNRLQEVMVRNRSRIDKLSYYGVGSIISNYQRDIYNLVYNAEDFNKYVTSRTQESLTDYFKDYLESINNRYFSYMDKIREYFDNAFTKGSQRVLDTNGKVIRFAEIKDVAALELIKNNQFQYIKNITDAQRVLVQKILTQGLDKGLSNLEIGKQMQIEIQGLSKARALTIARTEIVKAHNIGQVETLISLGAQHYIYWTAGDDKVSQVCKKLQGDRNNPNIYEVNKAGDANNPLPVIHSHPSCRCTIIYKD